MVKHAEQIYLVNPLTFSVCFIVDLLDNNGDSEERPQKKKRKLSSSQDNNNNNSNNNNQELSFIKVLVLYTNQLLSYSDIIFHFPLYLIFFFFLLFSQNLLVSLTESINQRLEAIESKLQSLDSTCKVLVRKLDSVAPCAKSPVQVPMVAGSPQGATQTWNKVRW